MRAGETRPRPARATFPRAPAPPPRAASARARPSPRSAPCWGAPSRRRPVRRACSSASPCSRAPWEPLELRLALFAVGVAALLSLLAAVEQQVGVVRELLDA